MPQMYPMYWLSLYMLFTLIFLMFSLVNFFSLIYLPKKNNLLLIKNTNNLKWKW